MIAIALRRVLLVQVALLALVNAIVYLDTLEYNVLIVPVVILLRAAVV